MKLSKRACLGGLAWGLVPQSGAAESGAARLLSAEGCGRATGYAEANKIVTIGPKTHVAWLDSPVEGFRARLSTLDRETGKWTTPVTVGEAHDNHGGPALTCDGDGFLHMVYVSSTRVAGRATGTVV